MKCWGYNSAGQTGGGTSSSVRTLTLSGTEGSPLTRGESATHIVAGNNHTCAILSDKSVKCWGSNSSGQTGGGTQNSDRTLTLSGTEGSPLNRWEEATHIAAGKDHTCAILSDKSVKCWGSNGSGQTGGGSPLSQIATHIAAGEEHTCAILADKSVKCWGTHSYGSYYLDNDVDFIFVKP